MRFIHFTKSKNIKSILKYGLIPKFSTKWGWEKLETCPGSSIKSDHKPQAKELIWCDILTNDCLGRYNSWLCILSGLMKKGKLNYYEWKRYLRSCVSDYSAIIFELQDEQEIYIGDYSGGLLHDEDLIYDLQTRVVDLENTPYNLKTRTNIKDFKQVIADLIYSNNILLIELFGNQCKLNAYDVLFDEISQSVYYKNGYIQFRHLKIPSTKKAAKQILKTFYEKKRRLLYTWIPCSEICIPDNIHPHRIKAIKRFNKKPSSALDNWYSSEDIDREIASGKKLVYL